MLQGNKRCAEFNRVSYLAARKTAHRDKKTATYCETNGIEKREKGEQRLEFHKVETLKVTLTSLYGISAICWHRCADSQSFRDFSLFHWWKAFSPSNWANIKVRSNSMVSRQPMFARTNYSIFIYHESTLNSTVKDEEEKWFFSISLVFCATDGPLAITFVTECSQACLEICCFFHRCSAARWDWNFESCFRLFDEAS